MAKLSLWNDTDAKRSIEAFVARVTDAGSPDFVSPDARIAVFDNDGTLWPEKPMPVELGFILKRLTEMASSNPALREQQPWKAAYTKDYGWLGDAVTKHYQGDDTGVKALIVGILKAFEGMSVDDYQAGATTFLRETMHPVFNRNIRHCGYAPMVELLRFLEANGFVNYIASGGDRDFMRVVTEEMYGIPAERVVGSTNALCYMDNERGGTIAYLAKPDVFDDGPAKPVRIWSRIGRRPILAFGNSNGDIQMLRFTGGVKGPALRLLLQHDDQERDSEYTAGAEKALGLAHESGWTVVSVRRDWRSVFAPSTQ